MDAFLVRTLLVPATVALLGRWNWWPSAHGRRQDLASAAAELTGPTAALTPKG
jgi:putative drug exporter of the RND superfamily